jgi:hypothetical protein
MQSYLLLAFVPISSASCLDNCTNHVDIFTREGLLSCVHQTARREVLDSESRDPKDPDVAPVNFPSNNKRSDNPG